MRLAEFYLPGYPEGTEDYFQTAKKLRSCPPAGEVRHGIPASDCYLLRRYEITKLVGALRGALLELVSQPRKI